VVPRSTATPSWTPSAAATRVSIRYDWVDNGVEVKGAYVCARYLGMSGGIP
jgi:hypothetical protein